ncbi:metallophosphoesterase [Limoniibacter endophyticus]|uniref:Metallophosphoesterase n=1 Tax=Limoniibacter endophyticus TaxID=1565040 RepID=A0A8J3DTJ8_9HYPH|nr:metallophosphoesterase [Limoniibacter endophyticus]GHC75267.1 metallophosphoesterase [Limoniibacter endophyticus]
MSHFVRALLCLYVISRFILPLPWPRWVKLGLSVVLMIVFQHSFISLLVFGTMFSPEVPRGMMIAVNWLAGSILLLAGFQLVLDLGLLALALFRRGHFLVSAKLRYGLGVVALALAAFAVSQAIRVPPVKEIEIAIKDLPREFDGYRLIQLTDLHISRLFQAPWVEETVAKANAQDADLIVITGDLIDGTLQARQKDVAPLAKLSAKDGVFAIPGNHEYYFDHDTWMRHYQELGMHTIANGNIVLSRGEAKLVLAGVNDLAATRFDRPGPDFEAAFADLPPGAPVILLNHQPRDARLGAEKGAALQLSGHTHGGMIIGFDRLIARFNNGFVSGMYDVDGMQLYVNNGTALWIGFALRLGVPSELTVITLRRR